MLTKQHFKQAADMVNAIRQGGWTFDPPAWAGPTLQPVVGFDPDDSATITVYTDESLAYTRAVWTAEAFIILFQLANPRFDQTKFLRACGLLPTARKERTA